MNARKLQTEATATILQRLVPEAPPDVAAAGDRHEAVDSPAMLLRHRLDAAIAAAPWAGSPPPATPPWPGAVRLSILAVGAAVSWAVAVAAVRALI